MPDWSGLGRFGRGGTIKPQGDFFWAEISPVPCKALPCKSMLSTSGRWGCLEKLARILCRVPSIVKTCEHRTSI